MVNMSYNVLNKAVHRNSFYKLLFITTVLLLSPLRHAEESIITTKRDVFAATPVESGD